jgi:hypothetical protein
VAFFAWAAKSYLAFGTDPIAEAVHLQGQQMVILPMKI